MIRPGGNRPRRNRPGGPITRRLQHGLAALLILGCIGLLAGCADVNDINRRILVSAIGLDTAPDGQVAITLVFFANETSSRAGGAAGGGGGGVSQLTPVVVSGTGPTVSGALGDIARQLPGQIFLGSTTMLLIGNELAQQGLHKDINYLSRHPHVSAYVETVIVDGRVSDVLRGTVQAAPAPGVHLSNALTAGTREDAALNTLPFYRLVDLAHTPWEFDWTALVAPGPIGPQVKGLALLQGDKMIRTLNSEDAHFIAPIRASGATHIVVPPLPGFGQPMSIRFRTMRVLAGRYNPGQTNVPVTMEGQAYLAEGADYTFAPPMGPRLREHVASYLARRLEETLTDLYSDGLDVLNLGQQARAYNPNGHIPDGWLESLPQLTFTVETNINFLQGLRGS